MKRAQEETMETWHSLWPQKVSGSLEFSDLLYDPKGHGDLCSRFDLVYDPKGHGSLEVAVTYFMTRKITVTFVVGLT